MLSARIPLLISLLSLHPSPLLAHLLCHPGTHYSSKPTLAACTTAITTIPSGTITFDGISRAPPLHFLLPDNARAFPPAVFHAAPCRITVWNQDLRAPVRRPRFAGPLEFYVEVWPRVRELARRVVRACVQESAGGFNGGRDFVEDRGIRYWVCVVGEW